MKQFVDSCVPELAVPVRVKHLNVGQEESGVASAMVGDAPGSLS